MLSAVQARNESVLKSTLASKSDTAFESVDYSFILEKLKAQFSERSVPIEIDFRKLINVDNNVGRRSHLIHTYPAKLLLNIPYFFLRCSSLLPQKGVVLDPFCGSGTVLLEAILAGHEVIGADANPLAGMIARVKTRTISQKTVTRNSSMIRQFVKDKRRSYSYTPQKILDWDYWFSSETQKSLCKLGTAISTITDLQVREFFWVCFSSCVRKVSFADQSVAVPVKLNAERFHPTSLRNKTVKNNIQKVIDTDVVEVFFNIVKNNSKRISSLDTKSSIGKLRKIYTDARNISGQSDCSVDLIITSPPYAGAQKYIRASSLSLGWLRLCPDESLRNLEVKNIGREHYKKNEYAMFTEVNVPKATRVLKRVWKKNPLRAHIAANYLMEMRSAIEESHRVLKYNSYFIMVIGNNVVCGENFETQKYIEEVCLQTGFKLELILRDDIKSRGLMTKRNKTASVIACEWIMVLRKTAENEYQQ